MNVILSIKPEFVEKIFSGEKQYEYRKILFKQKVDTVYIYACRRTLSTSMLIKNIN